jgi:preprotein translocase subunit SecA
MQRLGMQEGEAIESNLVSRAIENAQRKVEAHNFDIRKHLLEYDDVANDQRKVIYEWRDDLLGIDDISDEIKRMREDVFNAMIDTYIPPNSMPEQWDTPGLTETIEHEFRCHLPIKQWLDQDQELHEESLRNKIIEAIHANIAERERMVPPQLMRRLERDIMLDTLDRHWKEHLVAMDYLRQGIGLRGYAAKNPKQEYKREAFNMFSQMLENIKHDAISLLSKVQIRTEADVDLVERKPAPPPMIFHHPSAPNTLTGQSGNTARAEEIKQPYVRGERKIGRNEPCPCGSGKKYKQCHGKLA